MTSTRTTTSSKILAFKGTTASWPLSMFRLWYFLITMYAFSFFRTFFQHCYVQKVCILDLLLRDAEKYFFVVNVEMACSVIEKIFKHPKRDVKVFWLEKHTLSNKCQRQLPDVLFCLFPQALQEIHSDPLRNRKRSWRNKQKQLKSFLSWTYLRSCNSRWTRESGRTRKSLKWFEVIKEYFKSFYYWYINSLRREISLDRLFHVKYKRTMPLRLHLFVLQSQYF